MNRQFLQESMLHQNKCGCAIMSSLAGLEWRYCHQHKARPVLPDPTPADTPAEKARQAGPALLAALQSLVALIEAGVLVRNVAEDDEESWGMRQIPLVNALSKAQMAIEEATK